MNRIINYLKIFCIIIFSLIQFQCFSELNEPVMPEWDVALTVPIVKDYTLGEITDDMDDSRISFNPLADSQIIYKTSLKIDPIQINNAEYVELNSPAVQGKISLSDINFNLREGFVFESKLTDFLPLLPVNTSMIIPAISGIAAEKSTTLSSFNQITVDTAEFSIEITNQFPVDVTINSMTLNNNLTTNTLELLKENNIQINKSSTKTLTDYIINKNILNSLKLSVTLSTNGSGTTPVYIDANSSLKITFYSKKVKIFFAEASFDEQSYTFKVSSSLTNLGNKIQLNQAKIKNGKVNIGLKNYSALSGKFRTITPELTYNSVSFGTSDIAISAKGSTTKSYNITDYTLSPNSNSEFTLNSTVTMNSTNNQIVKMYGTDSISYSIEIKEIELSSFSGAISGDITQSFQLPKEDINKYFNGNIALKGASASLVVNNGSGLPFNISNGYVSGYNSKTGKNHSIKVKDTYVTPLNSTSILLDNTEFTSFLNEFTSQNALPDYFKYSTQVDLTTNNTNYVFSSRDTIGGHVDLTIPFYMSVSQLVYTDSAEINISDSEKDEMNKVNYGRITIRAANKIPLEGNLFVTFLNKKTGIKLILPKNYSTGATYKLSAGQTDNSGYSSAETISSITEELTKSDITLLSNSTICLFEVVLNTTSSTPVFLKRDDKIKLNVISEFGYSVK
jgi:hypothetical protein